MKNNELIEFVNDINLNQDINLNDIPDLDLYMDQVIQLFENKLSGLKRNSEDKVLTKTMINNYAKSKLLMNVKSKKYSKDHLILMSLIYDLKGILSISDIKLLLDNIVKKYDSDEDYDLKGLYEKYIDIKASDSDIVRDLVENKIGKLSINSDEKTFEEKFLIITSLINISNMYRRIGEKLIDEFFQEGNK